MSNIRDQVEQAALDANLSGVVRVDLDGHVMVERARGFAHRGLAVPNAIDTQFAIASGTKGFTALTVMSMVERGVLGLDTTARSVLGNDLPLIDDAVTVEQLLAHRSGIGDYVDEEADRDDDAVGYPMSVPVQQLVTTEDYLPALAGHATKFAPGERFSYSNGAYVVLALIAERVSGIAFHDLVDERVCGPAGMADTAFLRSDELPSRAATGYLSPEAARTNVFHLPVRGSGDGGIYTTVADVHLFWDAFLAGRLVSPAVVAEMVRPRSEVPAQSMQYGLGMWLSASADSVSLHGFDAGVSFVSVRHLGGAFAYTAVTNNGQGAWPVSQRIGELLSDR